MLTIDFSVQTATSLLVSISLVNAAGSQYNFFEVSPRRDFPIVYFVTKDYRFKAVFLKVGVTGEARGTLENFGGR